LQSLIEALTAVAILVGPALVEARENALDRIGGDRQLLLHRDPLRPSWATESVNVPPTSMPSR
jgi:hypothetical protein